MLHNFCKDTAPSHVRKFYLARLYRATADMPDYPDHAHQSPLDPSPHYSPLPRTRPRGDDGRFVPRADEEPPVDHRERKICGWCRTSNTSQWRVGPTNGSIEMGTLCNACGINYRRALAKSPEGTLNLDRLAQQMGHTRLSIQKALKRQRKLSAPQHQFKRNRPSRADRFAPQPRITFSNLTPPIPDEITRNFPNPPVLLHRPPIAPNSLDSPVYPVPRPPSSRLLPHVSVEQPLSSIPFPAQHISAPLDHSSPSRQSLRSKPEDSAARLPPFQSFIGELHRRPPM